MRHFVLFVVLILLSNATHAITKLEYDPASKDQLNTPRSSGFIISDEELQSARSIWNQPDASNRIEPEVLHELGRSLYRDGKLIAAKDAWNNAARREPNLPSAELMLAMEKLYAQITARQQKEAAISLKDIEKRFSNDPHFHLIRGEQALRTRNIEVASESFKKAGQLGPSLYVTRLARARIEDFQGEHPDARKFYLEATKLAPDKGRVWEYLGSHQFRGGDHDAALDSFKHARELDVRLPPAEAQMAQLSAEANDYIGARHWYKAAIETSEEGHYPLRMSLINSLLELRLFEEARVEIETLLKTGGKASLLSTLGYIAEQQGDDTRAIEQYRRAIELQPEDSVAQNNLAMLMIKTGRDAQAALKYARAAHKASPDSALVLGTYACALQNAGKQKEAGKVLPRAVQLNLRDAWLRYFYGKHLLVTGDKKKARIHLEGALVLDENFPRSSELNQLLKH